jgi:hypothetical protein
VFNADLLPAIEWRGYRKTLHRSEDRPLAKVQSALRLLLAIEAGGFHLDATGKGPPVMAITA